MTEKLTTSETVPDILYKYRYFDNNDYHLKLIEDATLWFSSAREFNDPFDSTLQFRFEDNPLGIRKKWAFNHVRREYPHLNRKERRSLVSQRLRDIGKGPQHIEWFKENYIESNYNRFGFCCFTPYKDNLLMWSHYSQNHQGFCVGLNTSKLYDLWKSLALKKKVIEQLKVPYSEDMPDINFFSSSLSNNFHDDIKMLLCTKSKHWEYEQEYRLIFWNNINSSVYIGHDILEEVILGCRISDKNEERILSMIEDSKSGIKVYQSIKNKNKFSLEFDEII